ncbi:type 1 glutamine amidotransferase [Amphiplicatus metriothermophilus]|nr:gamma-glutamyl-gamma-aminobutyrate hydrolase family protein [Amphiplicatus metriothermophilus]MBB5519113.1 GMP synthase-like glutamine amidotransferase [Amphiplicatus metriothermophilus]
MRIAIVETGAPPPALKRRHGGYPQMLERLLAPFLPGASFPVFSVFEGAPPPPLAAFDGLLLTGSPAGVYEPHAWIAPLEALVRDAARAGKPQVGVCFGHQLMAQAFGGRVEKSDKGWGVGAHSYDVFAPRDWMRPFARRIACAVSHQDQVTQLPPGAVRLAGSDFCPNGALEYPGAPAVSFQMHPEFDHAFAADLIRARRERIPAALADEALASLQRETDRMRIAQWIAAFFQSA